MKTAISLPDILFKKAETFAHRFKKTRSQLYAEALAEYLSRHSPDTVTEAINKVCDNLSSQDNSFVKKASSKILTNETW
jgi:metal-responsive CopG/Arc/MetJ family transcriptional regulator